ncbi:MAG: ribosome maturation factor RimM [Oscillospiraceae bacterium]|nr:ribosome maturation factor RimM [Oscillospiraceae bacterium]
MGPELIETGEIVRAQGVRGEVRVAPWADSPEFLLGFDRFYVDGEPRRVVSARVHGNTVVIAFDGVTDAAGAEALRGKTVWLDRSDARLEDGERFIADLIGLRAIDTRDGGEFGVVRDVLKLPHGDVYVVEDGAGREILIPSEREFVRGVDVSGGTISFTLIEGMR